MPSIDGLLTVIDDNEERMIEALIEMLRIPAIGPENGGDGEFERARFIMEMLKDFGFEEVEMYDALDERVRLRQRPNIIAKKKGESERTVWVVTHMDTVPPGDLDAWMQPPFAPKVENGKVYGLGAEDNGQAIIASIFAAKAMLSLEESPKNSLGLAIVADEEAGSQKGIEFLIQEGVFGKDDIIYVPDFGSKEGDVIEIAEKTILWLRIMVDGKQTHASTPDEGINALKVGSQFLVFLLDQLNSMYGRRDTLFMPDRSTFEPTKRLMTVGNVNTVPGEDVFYIDIRLLPYYDPNNVIENAKKVARIFEDRSGARIEVGVEQLGKTGEPSPMEGEAIDTLKEAIKRVRGVDARSCGIGGGTCANIFRQHGFQAYAWETVEGMAHTPDEYCKVDNLVSDSKVFAQIFARLCYPDQFGE